MRRSLALSFVAAVLAAFAVISFGTGGAGAGDVKSDPIPSGEPDVEGSGGGSGSGGDVDSGGDKPGAIKSEEEKTDAPAADASGADETKPPE